MLRLERLEISGFKSFYEKADITFPGAVTAIVGPNGCGKSNLCDAVAWVLGEQSARLLRSERMEDVIFNGSAKRRPLGMAEVTLTLRSDDGEFEGTEGVVTIGRRVYREGEGEYYLNGKRARLRDVQDLLLGTGLGVRAYSIIEQGRIEQVLSTKPQDRRRLIEEAAGITKYKLRKRAAELKLEETRGNLLRLSDIIAEVERNCNSLKRQASRAARYRELADALRAKRALLARLRYDRLGVEVEEASRDLADRRSAEAEASAASGRLEAELEERRRLAVERAAERERAREEFSTAVHASERDDGLLEASRRAATEISARGEAIDREVATLQEDTARRRRDVEALEALLREHAAESQALESARQRAIAESEARAATVASLERALAVARAKSVELAHRLTLARNARHEQDVEGSRLSASRARLADTRQRVSEACERLLGELADAEAVERQLKASADEASRRLAELEKEAEQLAGRVATLESERDSAREALWSAEQRITVLKDVLKNREGGGAGALSALSAEGMPVAGILADRLKPEPGWEELLDFLLGPDLQAPLTPADPPSAAAALRAREIGYGTLVRENFARDVRIPGAPAHPKILGDWGAVLKNATGLPAFVRAALPDVLFVRTLEDAIALSERYPHATFVTKTRELVRGSLVRIFGEGSPAEGVFTIRRDLEAWEKKRSEADARTQRLEKDLVSARARLEEIDAIRIRQSEERRAEERRHSAFAARLEERRLEAERLRRELDALVSEDELLAAEEKSLSSRRATLEEEERELDRQTLEASAEIDRQSEALGVARTKQSRGVDAAAAARTATEVSRERLAGLDSNLTALRTDLEGATRRLDRTMAERRELARRAEELDREAVAARQRRNENLSRRETLAVAHEAAVSAADEAAHLAADAETAAKEARGMLDRLRQDRFDAELKLTRLSGDLEHLVEESRREFGQVLDELPPAEPLSAEALEELSTDAGRLAETVEKMGPVNVLALDEYKEESQRLSYLTAQRDDLNRSVAQLQETIRKINVTSSERFAAAFAAINANFTDMFARLFHGGTAQMRLLDENDLLESGVEIMAQPPGKRNQSIQLLSGGEKALTAIALLMAIFRYKPSPFCILDEVDAPLDEANIDRFTRLLREMTEDTQFISITHNKRTMETADILYGVTMEEAGVSKIVSVKFD